jgi:hypothetical protein
MPNEQNSSQGRRPHYHRGRRGTDRRGFDRRTLQHPQEPGGRDQVDVEQIMREIRNRIARRHGIDLTSQQIQELAARRLEAILEPRHVKPALMEQMRRAAGESIEVPSPPADEPQSTFDEAALYQSHRGIVRLLRRWLNPILKLFFNPAPLVEALSTQARRNNAAAEREAELQTRQAEWNALHYEILQRLVMEVSRATIETQSLSMRMEALAAKIDFNERRVRGLEQVAHQGKPAGRPVEQPSVETSTAAPPAGVTVLSEGSADSARRRRRRRRGRRSGAPLGGEATATGPDATRTTADVETDAENDGDADNGELEPGEVDDGVIETAEGSASTSLEPAHAFSLLQPVERHPQVDSPAAEPQDRSVATPPLPPAQPSPPRDEPVPPAPVDHADPGPPDR